VSLPFGASGHCSIRRMCRERSVNGNVWRKIVPVSALRGARHAPHPALRRGMRVRIGPHMFYRGPRTGALVSLLLGDLG